MDKSPNPFTQPLSFFFQAIDPIRIEVFQKAFAFAFLIYMAAWSMNAGEWLTAQGFHLTSETRSWHHIDPFPLLKPWMVPLFLIVLFTSTLCLIIGWQTRKMIWVVWACAVYVQNVDIICAFTLNKFFIVIFLILALAPRPQDYQIKETGPPSPLISAWPVRIIQMTLLIQYLFAGTCKFFHGDWHSDPYALWSHAQGIYRTDLAAWMLRELPQEVWPIMMYSSLAFELLAPLLFCVKRLRIVGILWGIGFHLVIALTMYQLFYFSFQMITFYILFLDEDKLRTFVDHFNTKVESIRPRSRWKFGATIN